MDSAQKQGNVDRWRRAAVVACGATLVAGWLVSLVDARVGTLLFAVSALCGGAPTLVSTVRSLRAKSIDVDFLMLAGASGAAAAGHVGEAAVLLFLFSLAELLESYTLGRTRRAIESLIQLRPDEASVLENGQVVRTPIDAVPPGQRIQLLPGERVPLDAVVESGEADVDESALTGESVPVAKGPGDKLLAGSINLDGKLVARVTRVAEASTVARIIELVESARESRAPTQRLIDQFAWIYILLVLLGAVATAAAPPLFGWLSWSEAFYRAMAVLVVASPCALVLSTPATVLSAISRAARSGILFKGGAAVERLGTVRAAAFDKTGTLTEGRLEVTSIEPAGGTSPDELLAFAAASESGSEHPLARAIVEEAARQGVAVPSAASFLALPGRGVRAAIEGATVLAGNRKFLEALGAGVPPFPPAAGKAIWIARDGQTLGRIVLGDRMRSEAPAAVAALRRLGLAPIVMLTGDEASAAQEVARAATVDQVHSGLLPDEKVEVLQRLAGTHSIVMIGDGINDAPALAAADVGVAMGAAGADVAIETADVVLMSSHLTKLVEAVELGRRTRRILLQNLLFASLVLVTLVVLAVSGRIGMAVGVVSHEGSTMLVVLNGLRLLFGRDGTQTTAVSRPTHLAQIVQT